MNIYNKFGLVQIKTSSPRKFTSLVTLFDRDDFLAEIKLFRSTQGLVSGFYKKENVDYYLYENEIDEDFLDKYPDEITDKNLQNLVGNAKLLAKEIAEKYHRTENYELPIVYALLCNEVSGDELVTVPKYGILAKEIIPKKIPEMVMVFYPETTLEEVSSNFNKMKKLVTKDYYRTYYAGKMPEFDTMKNAERNREIYWMRRAGLSWNEISAYVASSYEQVDDRSLSKAFEVFEKSLST